MKKAMSPLLGLVFFVAMLQGAPRLSDPHGSDKRARTVL